MSDYDDLDYDLDYTEDVDDYYQEEIDTNGHIKEDDDNLADKLDAELYPAPEMADEGADAIEKPEEDEIEEEEEPIEEKKGPTIVPHNLRKSSPVMTKFEYSYLISQRAMAIENNSPLMIPETVYIHSIDIAKEETDKGVNPIIIQRVMPDGSLEEWPSSELRLPKVFD